jgi:hypothetical protein
VNYFLAIFRRVTLVSFLHSSLLSVGSRS